MATAETWLIVAAERREFDGILDRCGGSTKLEWPGVRFACEVKRGSDRWLLVANGPGALLVRKALERKVDVSRVISTGFCGALDPALQVGDIVVAGKQPGSPNSRFATGEILSADRVAVTAAEKRSLRDKTGAVAVEMEASAVAQKAAEWGVPFHCIRVVSDTAAEDLPLDFNLYRDAQGRFSRFRIALAAMARPFTAIPALLRLDNNCRCAAAALGEFFAHCQF